MWILAQPIERARQQEIGDLAAAVIVDQRVPVAVHALPRVGVLIERGAVEAAETVRVGREMARHPVEQQPETGAVAGIDKGAEIVGRAKPRGRREQRDRLVAPGPVERVLGDRHHLDMGEPEIGDIRHELFGQFAVGEIAPAARCAATTRDAPRRSRSARRAPAGASARRSMIRPAIDGVTAPRRSRRCPASARPARHRDRPSMATDRHWGRSARICKGAPGAAPVRKSPTGRRRAAVASASACRPSYRSRRRG